jgi:superoxide dismutase, Cu-Zn family
MIRTFAIVAALALPSVAIAKSPTATATLIDASGKTIGTAMIKDVGHGLELRVKARGLEVGVKAIHLHAVGKCEMPKFVSAGPHWNPAMKMHGKDNPMGPHAGDLPNLTVGANGRTSYKTVAHGFMLMGEAGLLDADGGAVIIHAKPDDYKSDPTGNAGDRIVCGVFKGK